MTDAGWINCTAVASNLVSRKPDDILRQGGVLGDEKVVEFLVRYANRR